MNTGHIHDAVAIGAGPFNLGFAALAENVPGLDVLLLEAAPEISWHPGMMLEGTHLQVPFMADLVTMADPTHRLSFLNYLKQAGRLYPFYMREDFHALRTEYNAYLQWAAAELGTIRFGHRVTGCSHADGSYVLDVATAGGRRVVRARNLVLGTGTTPQVPAAASGLPTDGPTLLHSSAFLDRREALRRRDRLVVVGSGQSAAEIFADLLESLSPGQSLAWATRSERFFPLEYTKLTLEMTSPEYIDHFHGLPQPARDRLSATQKSLFKGIDADLVNHIHELLYRRSVHGPLPVRLLASTALESLTPHGGAWRLGLRNCEDRGAHTLDADAVVLATGYSYREPGFLAGIEDRLRRLPDGRLDIDRHYAAGRHDDVLFQNAELHTHGFTAPDLGMGAYRNSVILNRIAGAEHLPVEQRIAFQEFGTPSPAPAAAPPASTAGPAHNATTPELQEALR